jgi:nucleoside-diphosphate-sugar epimerase
MLREAMHSLRTLVTGGAGFIESHLVDWMMKEGYEMTVLDNFSAGKVKKMQHHLRSGNFHLMHAQGTNARPEYVPPRAGDIRHSYADISKAERIWAISRESDWKRGIRRVLQGADVKAGP